MNRRTFIAGATSVVGATNTGRAPGSPAGSFSERSRFFASRRAVDSIGQDAYTPLAQQTGIITPADLHFSRHHFGAPDIDPDAYRLLVHGHVRKPIVLTLDDLIRLPSEARICFVECAGNGAGAFRRPSPSLTAGQVDGAMSTSEWVGVRLSTVLDEAGVSAEARWLLVESQDAGLYARSIPLQKAYDDAFLAYAQNGEPLRVEQGFPVRLVVPGWEGSASVKWVRRIELLTGPAMTRDETARYSEVTVDGKIHPFSFVMPVKSIITRPSFPDAIAKGWHEIRGLAWSGRGRVARVDISIDGGATWAAARLDDPVLPAAHTRFTLPWRWDGIDRVIMSRAVDETGDVQPTLDAFRAERTAGNDYRNNYVRAWRVGTDGQVAFASGCEA
jgi:sulfane dehydrogenase subunit SoxC